jgi:hypothetical protein
VRTRYRVTAVVTLTALVATALALVGGSVKKDSVARLGSEQRGLAFAKRNVDIFAKKGGGDSPASYADQLAALNAYPATSIFSDEIAAAHSAAAALDKRGKGKGKSSTSTWFSLGPTSAIYPALTNRSGSQYTASGRITALAIKPGCSGQSCTVWVASAGGGVWRTDKGLSGSPSWTNVSDGAFTSGAIGALTYDAASHTLYAGTGEDAAAADAEAGVGIYKSTDDGATWTALDGNRSFVNRSIRQIVVSGNTIYVADGRGVHGISATIAGPVSNIPNDPQGVGVWKSTDGGQSFTLAQPSNVTSTAGGNTVTFPSSFGSTRGATDVALDPTHAGVVYASAYNVGVWRSLDSGATWTQIKSVPNTGAYRSEFALATINGHTRMYEAEGDTNTATTGVNVADAVESGAPTWSSKTSSSLSSPYYATSQICTGQCWYDLGVYVPAEDPNMVYVFGSYIYGEDLRSCSPCGSGISNARAVVLSRDGGEHWTDLTQDGTSPTAPNGLHPDQHALITVPGKPLQFFEGSDGGLMRSDGTLVDTSSRCDSRPISGEALAQCKSLLSAVPGAYTSLNKGLQTLQFQHLSVNPANSKNVQGGTQDNGTFETSGSGVVWPQTVGGDGGMSGFDAANANFRFHTYFIQQVDVNFHGSDITGWDWISDPLFTNELQQSLFYMPIISDPTVPGSMFAGITWIWRTQDNGGPQAYLDQHCNEFTGDFAVTCGDWVAIGGSDLSQSPTFSDGTRAGGLVSWVQRSTSDSGTLWASTTLGRVFVSHNANAADPDDVALTRIDTLTGAESLPNRAISSIYVDPTDPNHAWISYLGYDQATPTATGHVFSVTYDPAGDGSVSVQDVSDNIGNQPVNAVVEDTNGDLYAATDFGVAKLPNGGTSWAPAADGLPLVTVASLTINPAAHQLLAATHGRGAYQLTLP